MRAVALIGIDGSGKTTQAHQLATALTAAGRPATYHRNAGGRRWLGRVAQRLGRPDAQRLIGRSGLLAVESVLRWLAIATALLSCLVTGRTAVMDRYAACQYVSTRVHGGQRWERLARISYRVFPPPTVTFLLALDPDEAYRRIERRGTDHESMAYLSAVDLAYRTLPEYPAFVVVDAGRPTDEVARQIQAHLAGWLPGPAVVPGPAAVSDPPAVPGPAAVPDPPAVPGPAAVPGPVAVADPGRPTRTGQRTVPEPAEPVPSEGAVRAERTLPVPTVPEAIVGEPIGPEVVIPEMVLPEPARAQPPGRKAHADPVGRKAHADPVGRKAHADPVGHKAHVDPVGRAEPVTQARP
ncbi:hypothetical protein GCM10012279_41640 [Micromonospora yangpuensis]|nr:hypothetical protein GCM10012279_41640 [Micromonospora yangpuensis]